MKRAAGDHLVCAIIYDGLCTFEFGIAVEIFALERPELNVPWYRFATVSIDPPPVRALGGFEIQADNDMSVLDQADTIVISGWRGAEAPVPAALVSALRAANARGARLLSICSGVFVLAATGLLDGRRAATHWRYTDLLQQIYPAIRVEPHVLYVEAGDNILTSAGSAAGLDLGVEIVRMDYGPEIANRVAKRLVVSAHREGGQSQFIDRPVAREYRRLGPLLDKLRKRMAEPLSVSEMAALAHMRERTFSRRFREMTGLSPRAWCTMERIRHAADLLKTSGAGIEEIASACGFGSPELLRHHFKKQYGVTPITYRQSAARARAAE